MDPRARLVRLNKQIESLNTLKVRKFWVRSELDGHKEKAWEKPTAKEIDACIKYLLEWNPSLSISSDISSEELASVLRHEILSDELLQLRAFGTKINGLLMYLTKMSGVRDTQEIWNEIQLANPDLEIRMKELTAERDQLQKEMSAEADLARRREIQEGGRNGRGISQSPFEILQSMRKK